MDTKTTDFKKAAEILSRLYILLGWELPEREAPIPEIFEGILIGLKENLEVADKSVERVSAGRIVVSRSSFLEESGKKIFIFFIYLEPSEVSWTINIEKINRTNQLRGIDSLDEKSRDDFFQFAFKLAQLLEECYEWEKKIKLEDVIQNLRVFCEVKFLVDELKKISKKLEPVYKLLNWKWIERVGEKIPSDEKIAKTLNHLAADVIGTSKGVSSSSIGGLTVKKRENGDYLEVCFCPNIFLRIELPASTRRLQLVNS